MPSSAPSESGDGPVEDGDVLHALAIHRQALRHGDAAVLEETLARGARRPSERDLLVDLVAAEGMEHAAKKLARFWRDAVTEPVAVRYVSEDEAEVYEQLSLGTQELDVVTLLRRTDDAGWRVVVTQRAPADVLRAKLIVEGPIALDETETTRAFHTRYGTTGDLIVEDDGGVFGHPIHEWVASVAPVDRGIDVALVPRPDPLTRSAQLAWLARIITVLAEQTGAPQVLVPAARKMLGIDAFQAVADTDAPSSRALLLAWAGLHRTQTSCYTAGLCAFGLPEAIATFTDWGDEEPLARKVVAGAARGAVGGSLKLHYSAVTLGGYRVIIEPGPRGPQPGRTFGRFGSIRLRPLRTATVTESGVVQRIDR